MSASALPTFGAGLRRLLFAPMSAQLGATTKMIVTQALETWLGNQITVQSVDVETSDTMESLPPGTIQITIGYVLIETQSIRQTQIKVV